MNQDDQSRSSSSGVVIAIVAVIVLLLVGGVVVLGLGGLFFFRLSEAPPRHFTSAPTVVVERAVMPEPRPTVELTAESQDQAATEMPPSATRVRKLTVRLDPQGKILADGQAVDSDQLQDLLKKAREDGKARLDVLVEVDGQCLFRHVAAVQAVCQDVGVEHVQVQARQGAPE
jgi:biopolymer transport protein ExbD